MNTYKLMRTPFQRWEFIREKSEILKLAVKEMRPHLKISIFSWKIQRNIEYSWQKVFSQSRTQHPQFWNNNINLEANNELFITLYAVEYINCIVWRQLAILWTAQGWN